jgi:hypothetical protein
MAPWLLSDELDYSYAVYPEVAVPKFLPYPVKRPVLWLYLPATSGYYTQAVPVLK